MLRLRKGILGRTDDMLTIRGNNIYPSTLEELIRQFPAVAEYRIQVRHHKSMQQIQIEIEAHPEADASGKGAELPTKIAQAFKDRFNFQVNVLSAPAGTLPRFEMKGNRFFRVVDE